MSHASVAARVRKEKDANPEKFCSKPSCLWRTGGGPCPRHGGPARLEAAAGALARMFDKLNDVKESQ